MTEDFEEFPSSDSDDAEFASGSEQDESDFDGFASTDDEGDDDDANDSTDKKTAAKKNSRGEGHKVDEQAVKDKIAAAQAKRSKESNGANQREKPGVVYVGRIPHGFYEEQMRSYFSQFGTVTRLRLSRNKKTGKSKHYAFIEFESHLVAEVVAETMDNYLLFGHILQVKLLPEEQVHEDLFVGANRPFKKVPWRKISRRDYERKRTAEQWASIEEREKSRRAAQAAKLKELGIDYDYDTADAPVKAPPAKAKQAASKAKKAAPKKKTKA